MEGTRARVRVLERLQQRPPTETESEDLEQPRCEQSGLEPGSSTESARDHHQPVEIKPSPRRRPSRIPLPGSASGKTASTTPTAGTTATTPPRPPGHGRNDSRESLKSLTRPPRDSSRDSHSGKSLSKTRDSNRDSLGNRSLSKNSGNGSSNGSGVNGGGAKETNRESSLNNRSLPRNNSSRDSLNKSSSLSRARDSLESNNNLGMSSPATGTTNAPPRRPPAPARRSHSLARAATSVDASENGKVRPVKQFFWSSWLKSPLSNGPV